MTCEQSINIVHIDTTRLPSEQFFFLQASYNLYYKSRKVHKNVAGTFMNYSAVCEYRKCLSKRKCYNGYEQIAEIGKYMRR